MIAAARALAARESTPASFLCANAQAHTFERASFDTIISRFGVMFFDNSIRAFANWRRAATDNAELQFAARRSAAKNPFMTTADRAAAPLLPNFPVRQSDASDQFAFANDRRVYTILQESGWAKIDIRLIDIACTLAEKRWSAIWRGSVRSAAAFQRRMTGLARKSSKRSEVPLIRMCTGLKSDLLPLAGWSMRKRVLPRQSRRMYELSHLCV